MHALKAINPAHRGTYGSASGAPKRRLCRVVAVHRWGFRSGRVNSVVGAGNNELMGSRSDAAVIAASIDDPAEFGRIFDRYATVMYRYFVRRVDPDKAQELLGELFRIAFERRCSFDQTRTEARPWLYGIASRLISKHWRSEYRRLDAVARLAARGIGGPDATERVNARLDVDAVWPQFAQAVVDLPSGERDVLVLRAWEDLSYDEIAESLGIPVGTVRSRLNRVRRRLRELDTTTGRQHHD